MSWFDFEFSPEAETKCCDVICRDQRNNLVTDVTVQQDAAFLSTCEQFNLPVYTHTHSDRSNAALNQWLPTRGSAQDNEKSSLLLTVPANIK